jgi:hypothetical protein
MEMLKISDEYKILIDKKTNKEIINITKNNLINSLKDSYLVKIQKKDLDELFNAGVCNIILNEYNINDNPESIVKDIVKKFKKKEIKSENKIYININGSNLSKSFLENIKNELKKNIVKQKNIVLAANIDKNLKDKIIINLVLITLPKIRFIKKTEENFEYIYGKRPYALINDSGHYFDIYNKELKNTIKYPNYEYLIKNIPSIIKSNKVIILFKTQEKEINLLKTYIPFYKTPIHIDYMINKLIPEFRNYIEYKIIDKINKSSYKERYKFLTLFVFEKIHLKYNLNPSYFYSNKDNIQNIWKSYNLSNIEDKIIKDYINSNEEFQVIFFLELMYSNLIGKDTNESKLIKILINTPIREGINIEKLKPNPEFIEYLFREGMLYAPTKETIARI